MEWIEITIKTTAEGTDIMTEVLYEAGVKGVAIEEPADISQMGKKGIHWDYIDESIIKSNGDEVRVKGYLPEEPASYTKVRYLKDRIKKIMDMDTDLDLGTGAVEMSVINEEDWLDNWKQYFKPRKVGKRIVIKPSWESYLPTGEEIILEIDPGTAFGTGTHETTILCIEALEKEILPGTANVLDIGCGTGILAVASILLGAGQAVAVDIDSNAVRITKQNAKRNGVAERIQVIQGNLLDNVKGRFNIIVANIIADVILGIAEDVKSYLKVGGTFIASGIIKSRADEVENSLLEKGYRIIEKKLMGEWAAITSRYE